MEVTIDLESQFAGDFEVVLSSVGSDEDTSSEREEDLIFFLYDTVYFGRPHIEEMHRELVEGKDELTVKLKGRFDTLDALEDMLGFTVKDGRLVYTLPNDEELIISNGLVEEDEDGRVSVSWPQDTGKITYKISSPAAWKPEYSLLPEYRDYLKDPERIELKIKLKYVNMKLEDGYSALKEKEEASREAREAFEAVLGVDPENETARKELEKLRLND
jgi:hypothetical protein